MKSMLGMCMNWKVLAGLGGVAAGVVIFAPGYALAVLPLLLFAACPLSMIAMMFAMRGMHGDKKDEGQSREQLNDRLATLKQEEAELRRQLDAPDTASSTVASQPSSVGR